MRAKVSWLGALKIWESLTLPRVAMFSEWAVELTGSLSLGGERMANLGGRLASASGFDFVLQLRASGFWAGLQIPAGC